MPAISINMGPPAQPSFYPPRAESLNTTMNLSMSYGNSTFSMDTSTIGKQKSKGGIWKGYYEQYGVQHPMIIKKFKAKVGGKVKGKGKDENGEFKLKGKVHSDGGVDFKKEYKGRHTVNYSGRMVGGTEIEGEWDVQGATGNFKISVSIPSIQRVRYPK